MSDTHLDKIAHIMEMFGQQQAKSLGSYCNYTCSRAESPIEAIFGRALIAQANLIIHNADVYLYEMNKQIPFEVIKEELTTLDRSRFGIWSQVPFDRFRLDFLIGFKGSAGIWFAAIECDGHDFHERTADQATRDKSRDRKLQIMGLLAFRFTGREIWNDAWAAAGSVVQALQDRDIEAFHKEMEREERS